MEYRTLGKTGLKASVIGLGCGVLGSSDTAYAVQVVQRALQLGVTFFDVARAYRDAEIKLGLALQGVRDQVVVSTKTHAKTREDAWREINESLERLQMDYVDNCHLHGLDDDEDMDERMGPGGALEALIEAKRQGMVRHIGASAHRSSTLIDALSRFDLEMILVPMNLVEREPLAELIPLCQTRNVGVTIMKPVATGLLPAPLALKWLINQPIASCVPGATTLEEVTENCMVGNRDTVLTPTEVLRADEIKAEWEHRRCRICGLCLPCPVDIPLPFALGSDVYFDHLRTMGTEQFRAFRWSRASLEKELPSRRQRIAQIEACTDCGACEPRCPYGLPIVDMLHSMLPPMRQLVGIYEDLLANPAALQT
jgi:predicted aldo/keto reductase-like oxidoreductase